MKKQNKLFLIAESMIFVWMLFEIFVFDLGIFYYVSLVIIGIFFVVMSFRNDKEIS